MAGTAVAQRCRCRWTQRTYRVQVLAEERMDVVLGIFRVRSLLLFLRVLDNGCHPWSGVGGNKGQVFDELNRLVNYIQK